MESSLKFIWKPETFSRFIVIKISHEYKQIVNLHHTIWWSIITIQFFTSCRSVLWDFLFPKLYFPFKSNYQMFWINGYHFSSTPFRIGNLIIFSYAYWSWKISHIINSSPSKVKYNIWCGVSTIMIKKTNNFMDLCLYGNWKKTLEWNPMKIST